MRGGGVILLIPKDLKYCDIVHPNLSHIDIISIKILNSLPIVLSVVYCPPINKRSHILSEIDMIFSKCETLNCKQVFIGDFNFDINSLNVNFYTRMFINLIKEYSLFQLIKFPTHNHCSTIDLLVIDDPSLVSDRDFGLKFSFQLNSSHAQLFLNYRCNINSI